MEKVVEEHYGHFHEYQSGHSDRPALKIRLSELQVQTLAHKLRPLIGSISGLGLGGPCLLIRPL